MKPNSLAQRPPATAASQPLAIIKHSEIKKNGKYLDHCNNTFFNNHISLLEDY